MLEGTVVNGVIVLKGGVKLPEGTRVRVGLKEPDDLAPEPTVIVHRIRHAAQDRLTPDDV